MTEQQHPVAAPAADPMTAPAPASVPAPTGAPAHQAPAHNASGTAAGPINDADVEDWKKRFNEVLAKPSEALNQKSPESARPWHTSLFGCFDPIDLCLISWCIPCMTFGKTHHRLRKHGSLEGYEPVNTSCLMFWGSGCIGCWWIPLAMQRADIRQKHHLKGDCITDVALACCCGLCDLIQQEKESEYQQLHGTTAPATGHQEPYKAEGGMAYQGPPAQ